MFLGMHKNLKVNIIDDLEFLTESSYFHDHLNELFDIYTTNQQEARYILTPHIIEAILSLHKKLRRPINLSFKENRVYSL